MTYLEEKPYCLFREVRAKKMDVNITDFKKCDFSRIYEYQKEIREKRKERTSEEKKAEKKQKDEESAPYVQAVVDGRLEKVRIFAHITPVCLLWLLLLRLYIMIHSYP